MQSDVLAESQKMWQAGRFRDASRILYESLSWLQRPLWAARILQTVQKYAPEVEEINCVLEITRDRSRWHESKSAFEATRARLLRTSDRLEKEILGLTENVAKVTYNAALPDGPFDADSGWKIIPIYHEILEIVGDANLTNNSWAIVSADHAMSDSQ